MVSSLIAEQCMRGSRKFCQKGSNSDNVYLLLLFFFWWGGSRREDPNSTKSGPSLARQRNAICDGPTLNTGLVALWFFMESGIVLLRNPIFLWFFRGYCRIAMKLISLQLDSLIWETASLRTHKHKIVNESLGRCVEFGLPGAFLSKSVSYRFSTRGIYSI